MAYVVERPLPRLGTFSAQCKEAKAVQQEAADQRAQRTLALSQYLASLKAAGLSLATQRLLVEKAMEAGVLVPGPVPAREQIRRLTQRWEAGHRSAVEYRAKPRSGRPKTGWDRRIVDAIITECETTGAPDIAALHRRLDTIAEAHGVVCPSYATTARLVAARGRTAREAARHGARSAELSATVAGHVPTRYTHDTWTLDAFDAPWWARGYCDRLQQWVSVRQTVILVRDYKSGATVGYLVVDPMRRRDKAGRRMRTGYTAGDITAAFLSATCPELAPPATKAYAGFLCRRLRIDNHATHEELRAALATLAEKATLELSWVQPVPEPELPPPLVGVLAAEAERESEVANVDVPRLPVLRPRNRGTVETAVGFLKRLCQDLPHSDGRVIPLDRIGGETLGHLRTKAATTSAHRDVRVDPVDVRRLPTAEEAADVFDGIVRRFNEQHVNRLFDETAQTRYHRFKPRYPRQGTDALLALPSHTSVVTTDGITYQQDLVTYAFAPEARAGDERVRLPIDTLVTYKRDPLGRGLFARVLDRLVFLPPKATVAEERDRDLREAQEQAAETRAASDDAVAARMKAFDARYGAGAATTDHALAEAQVQLVKAIQTLKREQKRAEAKARDEVARSVGTTAPPEWDGSWTDEHSGDAGVGTSPPAPSPNPTSPEEDEIAPEHLAEVVEAISQLDDDDSLSLLDEPARHFGDRIATRRDTPTDW